MHRYYIGKLFNGWICFRSRKVEIEGINYKKFKIYMVKMSNNIENGFEMLEDRKRFKLSFSSEIREEIYFNNNDIALLGEFPDDNSVELFLELKTEKDIEELINGKQRYC